MFASRICIAFAFLLVMLARASAGEPPQITWEWFNAAEIQLKQKSASNDLIAARYFRQAAEAGNVAAAYKLGEMLEEGRGVAQSYADALKWYRLAAARGDGHALFKVGLFLQKGWAVKRDPKEAMRAYAASADAGNVWAFHMLAFMLADGDGVPRNEDLAARYFERSLPTTGDHWAKWRLARLLEAKDPSRSSRLMAEAAQAGNPEALKLLASLR